MLMVVGAWGMRPIERREGDILRARSCFQRINLLDLLFILP